MLFLRVIALIASFAFLAGGAEAAAKAPTADICAGTAGEGGIKLAASGEPEGSCCPPLSCKKVKFCRERKGDRGESEGDKGCCYNTNRQVCSCKRICASCR